MTPPYPGGPLDDGGPGARAPGASPLLAHHVERWPRRVPPVAIKVTVVVALVVAIVVSVATETELPPLTAAVVESPSYLVENAIYDTMLASIAVVLVAPTLGLAIAVLGSLALSQLVGGNAGGSVVWTAVGVLLTALALTDALARALQFAVARVWREAPRATFVVPDVPAPLREHLVRTPWGWFGSAAVCAVLGLGGLALFGHDASAAAGFRADSLVSSTRVDALTDDDMIARVTIDGTRYRVPFTDFTPAVGQVIEVRYQPRTGRAEWTEDVFDPTDALIPGLTGSALAVALFATGRGRRRRLVSLLARGGIALEAQATWSALDDGALLRPCDDGTRVLAIAPDLRAWMAPPDGPTSGALWPYDDRAWIDGDRDENRRDESDAVGRPNATMSDATLLVMAHRLDTNADEAKAAKDAHRPLATSWDNTPVLIVGLSHDGAPVALRDAGGRWYVTRTPLRRPRWRGRERPFADHFGVVRRVVRWLPWVALPVLWWALRWFLVGSPWYETLVIGLGLAAVGGWTLSMAGQVQFDLEPRWLRVRRGGFDRLLAWPRIASVISDDVCVVVRLEPTGDASQGDALLFALGDETSPLTRERAGSRDTAARLERARADYRDAPPLLIPWRPSTPLLAGLCWLAVALVAGRAG